MPVQGCACRAPQGTGLCSEGYGKLSVVKYDHKQRVTIVWAIASVAPSVAK